MSTASVSDAKRSLPILRETENGTTEGEEPPNPARDKPASHSLRHPAWHDVPDHLWNDWRWQSQNAIRSVDQLTELLTFSDSESDALRRLGAEYKLAIPPYYFSLIDPDDPDDPIRLQSVASPLELKGQAGAEEDDPLDEDKDSPVRGLTHRYPDRVLMVTTHVCTMYCRFCTRKRATMKRGGWDAISRDDALMIDYVRKHSEIHDVIVSGGDPLTLPLAKLEFFLESLSAMDHVGVIRLGTRVPVTLPQRLYDPELIAVIKRAGKVWIQTHFNHPREVTPEAAHVCRRLLEAGCPLNNHSVLLKGVNDSVETMRELCRSLLRAKIRPYYLFHCDPVTGAGHFRTSIWKGLEIIEGLRGHISGLGVPTYVVDAPRGGGKIPLMPNYLVSASNEAVVLRNYEGMLVRYNPDGHAEPDHPPYASQGVSALLAGQREVLMPEDTPRMRRRQAIAAAQGDNAARSEAKHVALISKPLRSRNGHARSNGANGTSRRNGQSATRPMSTAHAVAPPISPVLPNELAIHKTIRPAVRRKKAAV